MESVLNSLFPVFILLAVGVILKRMKLTGDTFLKVSDKLVYYIFFPALLFWKIGGAQTSENMDLEYCFIALVVTGSLFVFSLVFIRIFRISDFGAGSFSQSCYRFNTYIGMAVIINALGSEGIRYFGILISIVIPFINVVAVSTLIWFSGKRISQRERMTMMAKAILSNPLILACIAGIIYANLVNYFPPFLENTFKLMTSVTLPLALLSIGGSLTLKGVSGHLKASWLASGLKLVLLPVMGYFLLKYFHVSGIPFRVTMIFFTLPTATSIYVLSSQMNSDTELASSAIVLSTVLSFVPLSIALVI